MNYLVLALHLFDTAFQALHFVFLVLDLALEFLHSDLLTLLLLVKAFQHGFFHRLHDLISFLSFFGEVIVLF